MGFVVWGLGFEVLGFGFRIRFEHDERKRMFDGQMFVRNEVLWLTILELTCS